MKKPTRVKYCGFNGISTYRSEVISPHEKTQGTDSYQFGPLDHLLQFLVTVFGCLSCSLLGNTEQEKPTMQRGEEEVGYNPMFPLLYCSATATPNLRWIQC